jgi:hypothetical protein
MDLGPFASGAVQPHPDRSNAGVKRACQTARSRFADEWESPDCYRPPKKPCGHVCEAAGLVASGAGFSDFTRAKPALYSRLDFGDGCRASWAAPGSHQDPGQDTETLKTPRFLLSSPPLLRRCRQGRACILPQVVGYLIRNQCLVASCVLLPERPLEAPGPSPNLRHMGSIIRLSGRPVQKIFALSYGMPIYRATTLKLKLFCTCNLRRFLAHQRPEIMELGHLRLAFTDAQRLRAGRRDQFRPPVRTMTLAEPIPCTADIEANQNQLPY